jgi:hypothetical protein
MDILHRELIIMRTKEEITDLITEIDNGIGTVKDKIDIEYLGDVKATLQWVLKKISTEKETTKIEEKMKKITGMFFDDMSEDDYKASMDFMNKEFGGRFKVSEETVYNVSDACEWILENTSTEEFLSINFLKLK